MEMSTYPSKIRFYGKPIEPGMVVHMNDPVLQTRMDLCTTHLDVVIDALGMEIPLDKDWIDKVVELKVDFGKFAEGFFKAIYSDKMCHVDADQDCPDLPDLYDKFFHQHTIPWKQKIQQLPQSERNIIYSWLSARHPDIQPWNHDGTGVVLGFWLQYQEDAAKVFWEILSEFVFEEVPA